MRTTLLWVMFLSFLPAGFGQTVEPTTNKADEVMARVYVRDRQREQLSHGFAGTRLYILDNQSWNKHSEMLVSVRIDTDGSKHFEVVSEEGSKSANKRVLRKMLESEAETSRPGTRAKALLTPENYAFSLLRNEVLEGRPTYVIAVTPKRHDKYLFEGQIWIDGIDYALVRAEGKPAQNPSFWTHSVHFIHQYRKSGEYWLPMTTDSVTQARIFGKTDVTIRYFDYAPNSAPARDASNGDKPLLNEVIYAKH